jgi:hypothetical protein
LEKEKIKNRRKIFLWNHLCWIESLHTDERIGIW